MQILIILIIVLWEVTKTVSDPVFVTSEDMLTLAIEHSMCTVFKMHHTCNLYSGAILAQ